MSKLPKWFNGEVYTEGATVQNRFGGDSCQLSAEELSMYDFVIGASNMCEMGIYTPQMLDDMRKGLNWFRENNVDAYYKLLD